MLVVLFLGTARVWKERRELSALITVIAGLVSAYLMNRERVRAENSLGTDRSSTHWLVLAGLWLNNWPCHS